jgi:hypothetical protein
MEFDGVLRDVLLLRDGAHMPARRCLGDLCREAVITCAEAKDKFLSKSGKQTFYGPPGFWKVPLAAKGKDGAVSAPAGQNLRYSRLKICAT